MLHNRFLSPSTAFRSVLSPLMALLFCVSGGIGRVSAALVFTNDMRANFQFEVVAGPLTGLGFNVGDLLDFEATGAITFTLDDSVPNAVSMPFTNATGVLQGVQPNIGPFTVSPNVQFVGGNLNNIVRNGSNVITSATVSDLRMFWELQAAGLRFYSGPSLDFNGNVTGTPFQAGDVIAGPANFDVFLDLGPAGPDAGDPLATIGRNRTLTAVPEPSSLACCSLVLLGLLRRRKRNA